MSVDTAANEVLDAIEGAFDSPFSDGLPIVPPTQESVRRFVAHSGLEADAVLGPMAPSLTDVTVHDLAVSSVMAGCRPEYAPVVVAAVRCLIDEDFDLYGISCSTKGAAPLLIVNGPVRSELGFNATGNVLGHGFRANATISRALRLLTLRVGGALPMQLDRATMGHPGRYAFCVPEDEEGSPWEPLHVERGLALTDSAVTAFGGEAPRQVNMHHNTPEAVLAATADTIATTGVFSASNITGRSQHVVVYAKEHRDLLHENGWTKPLIKEYLAEHAVLSTSRLAAVGTEVEADQHVIESPDDVLILAAGGPAGRFAAVITGWSWQSRPITTKVEEEESWTQEERYSRSRSARSSRH